MNKVFLGGVLFSLSFSIFAAGLNNRVQLEDIKLVNQLGETKIETNACFFKGVNETGTNKQLFRNTTCATAAEELKQSIEADKDKGNIASVEIVVNDKVFYSYKK